MYMCNSFGMYDCPMTTKLYNYVFRLKQRFGCNKEISKNCNIVQKKCPFTVRYSERKQNMLGSLHISTQLYNAYESSQISSFLTNFFFNPV